MMSPQGRNMWIIDDLVPYVDKIITILSEEQERIIESVSHGPPREHQFAAQEFHILLSSVETQGIGRQREAVEAEPYFYPQMKEHGHGMYYTPPTFSHYPTHTHMTHPNKNTHTHPYDRHTNPNHIHHHDTHRHKP